jgi:hypothetical protein
MGLERTHSLSDLFSLHFPEKDEEKLRKIIQHGKFPNLESNGALAEHYRRTTLPD